MNQSTQCEGTIGLVSLVGAGPGDPGLITVLGRRRLEQADVILYDHLVNPALFAGLDAQTINVGKEPHGHRLSQERINVMMVELSQRGRRVVRLKSGDPYVFGRGREEREYLLAHQVPCEVVPGVTSALAGPAAVGIALTHRDYASEFHVISGHRKPGGGATDWSLVAQLSGTTVLLMGMGELEHIASSLLAHGKAADTPVAVIQWATTSRQRSLRSDLAHVASAVAEAGFGPPSLIVIGDVVNMMDCEHMSPEAP